MGDLDSLEAACERTAQAQRSFAEADKDGAAPVHLASALMEACADLSTHVPTILALLHATEAETEWNLDMAAAPLGDTRMLVCLREPTDNPWKVRVAVARFDPAIAFWITDSGRRIDPPIAWQRLPAAPEAT